MIIKGIQAIPVNIPLLEPFKWSGGVIKNHKYVIIKLKTKEGIIGYGEASGLEPSYDHETQGSIVYLVKEYLEPMLIGKDLSEHDQISSLFDGIVGNDYAKASIDMAIFDALGKHLQLPISKLLGGSLKKKIEAQWTIGIKSSVEMAKDALKSRNEGYRSFKIKVGENFERDVEHFKIVRDTIGGNN